MSIASEPLSAQTIAEASTASGKGKTPPKRQAVAKADVTIVPEPR